MASLPSLPDVPASIPIVPTPSAGPVFSSAGTSKASASAPGLTSSLPLRPSKKRTASTNAKGEARQKKKRTGGGSDRTKRNLRADLSSFLDSRFASPDVALLALNGYLAKQSQDVLDAVVPESYKTHLRRDLVSRIEELWDARTAAEIKTNCGLSDEKMDYLRRLLTKRYNAEQDVYEDVALYDNVYVPKIASKRKVKKFLDAVAAEQS